MELSAAPAGAADVAIGPSPGDLPARIYTLALEVAFQPPLPDPNDAVDADPAAATATVAAAPPAAPLQPPACAPTSKANRRK